MRLAGGCVRSPIRLIGVYLGALAPAAELQQPLFREGNVGLNAAADEIRKKFGERSVTSCRTLSAVRS
jgi:hypothetical protein